MEKAKTLPCPVASEKVSKLFIYLFKESMNMVKSSRLFENDYHVI